jgi:hypothetical protein
VGATETGGRSGETRIAELARRGIAACFRRDASTVAAVLLDLTASLDFRYDGAARRLADLYRASLLSARRGVFRPALAAFRLLADQQESGPGR